MSKCLCETYILGQWSPRSVVFDGFSWIPTKVESEWIMPMLYYGPAIGVLSSHLLFVNDSISNEN